MAKSERMICETKCDGCGSDMTDQHNYGEIMPGGKPPMLMEPYDNNDFQYGVVCYVTRDNGEPIDICHECMKAAMLHAIQNVTRG